METSKFKNMVVLKDIPSNIIDEAIIVLKANKKIKKLQKVEQNIKQSSNENKKKDKEYILKEAEMIVNNYISKIEKNDTKDIFNKNIKLKYKKLKKYSIVITTICFIQLLILIF